MARRSAGVRGLLQTGVWWKMIGVLRRAPDMG